MKENLNLERYLQLTRMLDFKSNGIQHLISKYEWKEKENYQKILEVYNFVRDEVRFGYSTDDSIPASQVLKDGYGQCNTKGTLFMAILRGIGVPCRIHGFTINKRLQKGVIPGLLYRLSPDNVVHSWVEVYFNDKWCDMEGLIIDKLYLKQLQKKFSDCTGSFCGYGIGVTDFANPKVNWNGDHTYIQKEGINHDFGVFDTPDEFFESHPQQLNAVKMFLYQKIMRHLMNRKVRSIRNHEIT